MRMQQDDIFSNPCKFRNLETNEKMNGSHDFR